MALVWKYHDEYYRPCDEYNVDNMSISEAIDAIIKKEKKSPDEYRITRDERRYILYWDEKVEIEKYDESKKEYKPYLFLSD